MGLLSNLFAPAVGETVKDISEGISTLAGGIRSAITGEMPPKERAQLERMAIEADKLSQKAQAEINKIEAQHKSLFVAGWRPFIGWVCGSALAFNFVLNPLITWMSEIFAKDVTPPVLDMGELYPLVLALLGLGAYRSYEKVRKVQDRH